MRSPPVSNSAPFLIPSLTMLSILFILLLFTKGPMSVFSERGSPTLSFSVFWINFSINSFAILFTTKNLLVAMQLCPVFMKRPFAAPFEALSTSASPQTMKGSLPPSSSTHFFSCDVALCATFPPTESLPVNVTPAPLQFIPSSHPPLSNIPCCVSPVKLVSTFLHYKFLCYSHKYE